MGYTVQDISGGAASNRRVAEFLAAFVRDGELNHPREGDDNANVWQKRFSWWWDENPFSEDDSPKGYLLLDQGGEVVGFSGFIPFQYEFAGDLVPTLVATTFFVREAHRGAVMGMISRQRTLGKTYHIIDGSPSPEMRRLLGKLGYEHADDRRQYYFPLAGFGGAVSQRLLRRVGLSLALPDRPDATRRLSLVTDPGQLHTIPARNDHQLHRRITAESLAWLTSVGSEERSFFGLCDADGSLMAYAIGIYKRKHGLCVCLLDDYADFLPHRDGLAQLLRHLMDDPIGSGIARDTDFMALSLLNTAERPDQPGLRRRSLLYYHLPQGIPSHTKRCLPIEGDLALI